MHVQLDQLLFSAFALMLLAAAVTIAAEGQQPAYTLSPAEHGMELKTPDGRSVFQYMTRKPEITNLTANSVCCLYPVLTPSGVRAVDFAPGDHRHHRGIFLAWHTMKCGEQAADFWGWGEMAPTEGRVIRNRDVRLVAADGRQAELEIHNDWCIADKTVLQETLSIVASELDGGYLLALTFRFDPQVDITLNQTAFGGLCVKGRKEGKAVYSNPAGKLELPNPHHLKPETDWPAEAWYDYTVQLEEGKTVGVTVIDHPSNPPTLWHNLEPIAMVNPCIAAPGPVTIKQGKPLTLRYLLVVHDGTPDTAAINTTAKAFRSN